MRSAPHVPALTLAILYISLAGCARDGDVTSGISGNDVTADSSVTLCPDGLVYYEEQGICAPYIPECEHAWEMPTVDGECVAVGPRACPKAWDSEAAVDCISGDLLPCPEGFVPTEDEVACIPHFDEDCDGNEIPVLGGGCRKVGPLWGEEGQPFFDECGEGILALPGGGCVMIGPRACPKLWDPEADVDCGIGDVLPCPEGWIEQDDGLTCEPIYDDCNPGERPLLGGGCAQVVPLVTGCPEGAFPLPPENGGTVLYVLAGSGCTAGCGSEESPYASIQAAVDAAPAGAWILVGEGDYDEGLRVEKPLQIAGVCSARVRVSGSVLLADFPDGPVPEAGVAILGTSGVRISGIAVAAPAPGILVSGSDAISLDAVEVDGSHGPAVSVAGGSQVEMQGLWIHDTQDAASIAAGYGLWVAGGAVLSVSDSLVEMTNGRALLTEDPASVVTLERCTLRDALGQGMEVRSGSQVTVRTSLLDGNEARGVTAVGTATSVLLEECVIRDTTVGTEGVVGGGIQVGAGAAVSLYRSVVAENRGFGVRSADSDSEVLASGTVVRDNGYFGVVSDGMSAIDGGRITARGCLVSGNWIAGVYVENEGSEALILGTVVQDTLPNGNGENGVGVHVWNRGRVSMSQSLTEGNREAGVFAADSDTEVDILGSVIRDTIPRSSGALGVGIYASWKSRVSIADSLVDGNTDVGVRALDSETEVDLEGSVIRGTKAGGPEYSGMGVFGSTGSRWVLRNCLVEDNVFAGVAAVDSITEIRLEDSAVRYNRSTSEGIHGVGVYTETYGVARLHGCLVEGNAELGVLAILDSRAFLDETVIRDTVPNGQGKSGGGAAASGLAHVELTGCLVEGNSGLGLWALKPGSRLVIVATAVRDTQPTIDGEYGYGVAILDGSTAEIVDCLVEANTGTGIWSLEPDAEILVRGTVVRGMLPGTGEEGGVGVMATAEGSLHLEGCLVEGNTSVNIFGGTPGSILGVEGTMVRNQGVGDGGHTGSGLIAVAGATVEVRHSFFAGNVTGAVWVETSGTVVSLVDTAVLATRGSATGIPIEAGGEVQSYGDGAIVDDLGRLDLTSSLVAGNDRAGIYYKQGTGSIAASIIAGNDSYGLVLEESAASVTYGPDTIIKGNGVTLPPGWDGEVTSNPGGLPLPELPEIDLTEPGGSGPVG